MFTAHDYPGAVREFAKAVSLNPKVPSLQSFYGQALLATGDADGAAVACADGKRNCPFAGPYRPYYERYV